jgi:acetylornithine deacetylase/succinyl-diaminopimelate desuccinylase-like protein
LEHRTDHAPTTRSAPGTRPTRPGVDLALSRGPGLGLCLILVVLVALGAGAAREAQAVWPFGALFDRGPISRRAVALLSEAIQIRTANPPGNERALARRYARAMRGMGVETRLLETPGPEDGPGRAALWARLPSRLPAAERKPALVLLSHLDTVPADSREWSVDPWAGEVWDGFVWGRGALDAKGVGVAQVMAMVSIAESDVTLDRDLIVLATPEEETGGRNGAGWLVEHHPELLTDVGYLLTEGGGIQPANPREPEQAPLWGVTLTEKSPCWLELRVQGRAGHSAAPTADAAVPRLVSALDRIRRFEAPIRVVPEVALMFTAMAPTAAEWDRAGFIHLAEHLDDDAGFRRRFLDHPGQNALVRNTISITVLEGAPKTNVAPGEARAQLDARLLPGERCDAFANTIRSVIDDDSVEVTELLSFPAVASSHDTPLYRAIERVAAAQAQPGRVIPRMIGGFTDAHWFREKGITAYGFIPRALPREEGRRVHGIDERIAIDTLKESIRLTVEIVKALDAEERTPR